MTTRLPRTWRVGDKALVHRERVTFLGYIDHGGPGPFDEVLVEFVAKEGLNRPGFGGYTSRPAHG